MASPTGAPPPSKAIDGAVGSQAAKPSMGFAGSDSKHHAARTRPFHERHDMQLRSPDLIWPIVGAIVAGAVIGAEREYRASPAGLRTHILVSLSCCLLVL